MPVKRKTQVVTSPFGERTRHGVTKMHRGVDLRTVRFPKESGYLPLWSLQDIVFPERCMVLRKWFDVWGGGIAVRPLETIRFSELKFIHIDIEDYIEVKAIYEKGEVIGKSMLTKKNTQHHLHFEVHQVLDDERNVPVNPTLYFDLKKIEYEYK